MLYFFVSLILVLQSLWFSGASWLRDKATSVYKETLSRDQASLLSGIVLGGAGLDRQFKNKLANAGLTHVVAASGMNVSIFSGFLLGLLSKIRISKIIKVIVAIVFTLFYATLTGFAPPIVRATIMFIFVLVASLFGRQNSGFVGLFIAAFLMLWVSPKLVTDASFLLSFASMTGQIFLSTIKLDLPKLQGLVIENFLQSFLALLFTAPLVIIFFAKFSLVAIFTNILVLWTIEPLMILGGVEIVLGIFFTEAARLIALPASGLLGFFLWVVNYFSQPSWAVVHWTLLPGWPTIFFILGYYLTLAGIIIAFSERRNKVSC